MLFIYSFLIERTIKSNSAATFKKWGVFRRMAKNSKLESIIEENPNKSFFSLNTRKFVANKSRLSNFFQRKSSTRAEKMHAEHELMSAMQASAENADSVALSSNAESEPSYGFVSRFIEESSQLIKNVPGITPPTPVVVSIDPSFLKYHDSALIHDQKMEVEVGQNEKNEADKTAMDLGNNKFSSEMMMQDNQPSSNTDDATNTHGFEDVIWDDLHAADHFMKDPPSSNYNFDATAQLAQIKSSSNSTSNLRLHLQAEGAEMARSAATALAPASSCHPSPDSKINPIMDDLRAAAKIAKEIKDAAKALSLTPFAHYPPICPISTVNNIYLINSSTINTQVANTSNQSNISNIAINPESITIPRICAAKSNMSPGKDEMIGEAKNEETKKRVFHDATEGLARNQNAIVALPMQASGDQASNTIHRICAVDNNENAIVALPMRARCHQTEEGCPKFMRISNKSENKTSDN